MGGNETVLSPLQTKPEVAKLRTTAGLRSAIRVGLMLAVSACTMSPAKPAVAGAPVKKVPAPARAHVVLKPLKAEVGAITDAQVSTTRKSGLSLKRERMDLSQLPASAFGDAR